MSERYKKPYVESSVFIAFIKGEKQGPNKDQDAKLILDSIIDHAKAGAFKIITSGLTIAEVHKTKKTEQLTEKENEDLRPYFRGDYIQIVEVDREVGERANELCRSCQADPQNGFKVLRPNDAIHIASAERAECDVVLAWDPDFLSQGKRITTIKLENPELLGAAKALATQEALALTSASENEPAEPETPKALPPASVTIVEKNDTETIKGPDGVQSRSTP